MEADDKGEEDLGEDGVIEGLQSYLLNRLYASIDIKACTDQHPSKYVRQALGPTLTLRPLKLRIKNIMTPCLPLSSHHGGLPISFSNRRFHQGRAIFAIRLTFLHIVIGTGWLSVPSVGSLCWSASPVLQARERLSSKLVVMDDVEALALVP